MTERLFYGSVSLRGWHDSPDGRQMQNVTGNIRIVSAEEALGVKVGRSDSTWFAEVKSDDGTEAYFVPGCEVTGISAHCLDCLCAIGRCIHHSLDFSLSDLVREAIVKDKHPPLTLSDLKTTWTTVRRIAFEEYESGSRGWDQLILAARLVEIDVRHRFGDDKWEEMTNYPTTDRSTNEKGGSRK